MKAPVMELFMHHFMCAWKQNPQSELKLSKETPVARSSKNIEMGNLHDI